VNFLTSLLSRVLLGAVRGAVESVADDPLVHFEEQMTAVIIARVKSQGAQDAALAALAAGIEELRVSVPALRRLKPTTL